MLYRLVRPVRRKGSNNHQFIQRIPTDLRSRVIGRKLDIPVGEEIVPLTITQKMTTIRLSLRTADPGVVKIRHAQVAACLEGVWQTLRSSEQPARLTHKQAVAFSKRFYAGWAEQRLRERTITVEFLPGGRHDVETSQSTELESEAWEAAFVALGEFDEHDPESVERIERMLGPVVRYHLLKEGIAEAEPESWRMLLKECRRALLDAFANRTRNADGDFSSDPKAARFPMWEASALRKASSEVLLTGLIEGWCLIRHGIRTPLAG